MLLLNTFKSTMCINEKIKFYNNVTNSSAAAMSSVDSSLLSGATYLTHNIYGKMVEISNDIGQFSQNRWVLAVLHLIQLHFFCSTFDFINPIFRPLCHCLNPSVSAKSIQRYPIKIVSNVANTWWPSVCLYCY